MLFKFGNNFFSTEKEVVYLDYVTVIIDDDNPSATQIWIIYNKIHCASCWFAYVGKDISGKPAVKPQLYTNKYRKNNCQLFTLFNDNNR